MDLPKAQELKSSLLWGELMLELDKFIYFETIKLKTCTSDELKDIQARIYCYETLKGLPDVIIDRESEDGKSQ